MTESHLRRLAAAAKVALAITVSACEQQTQEPAALVVELRRTRMATVVEPAGPLLLVFPIALTQWRDSLAIADRQGARIVVLPRTLEGEREYRKTRRELKSPHALAASRDELVVNDRGNLRATWFEPSGTQLRSQQLGVPSTTSASLAFWKMVGSSCPVPLLSNTWN